ncbi:MAG TPA: hypothetical protein VGP82_12990 [Ktedonobacterales bacterium]|nr:hypothetical protein [Ktedonobacterales bacterium]
MGGLFFTALAVVLGILTLATVVLPLLQLTLLCAPVIPSLAASSPCCTRAAIRVRGPNHRLPSY